MMWSFASVECFRHTWVLSCRSHKVTVLSSDPDNSIHPSFDQATEVTDRLHHTVDLLTSIVRKRAVALTVRSIPMRGATLCNTSGLNVPYDYLTISTASCRYNQGLRCAKAATCQQITLAAGTVPASRVPLRLNAMHLAMPSSRNSSIVSGNSTLWKGSAYAPVRVSSEPYRLQRSHLRG